MGSLKALQEWCRIQCENYNDVEIKNMSTSFRDGMAFCAIIHRYRPDLIDFNSLSKENVYENNRLAFEVAETELGIPALLDPEDMVSMKVPDRLSIITYVSQYYNFFTNKSHANPPIMKRPSGTGHIEPAQKKPTAPLEDKMVESEPNPEPGLKVVGEEAGAAEAGAAEAGAAEAKRVTLSSTCAACRKHVHLVQRFLVDGRLYHRNCFRCRECSSTLLPGSYKPGSESGSLVCTHHFGRAALTNQNGRPDLSKKPVVVESARVGPSTPPQTPPQTPPSERDQIKVPSHEDVCKDHSTPADDSTTPSPPPPPTVLTNSESEESEESEAAPPPSSPPSSPPNPFDESDEEGGTGKEEEEESQTPANETANGSLPASPVSHVGAAGRPVPAPRRVSEVAPPPRPAPRVLPPRVMDTLEVNGEHRRSVPAPRPRDRSHSPGRSSLSNDTPKPKDPPWLALVQSEPKKKPAPPPPPGTATPPHQGSLSSLKGAGSRPATPPVPANPFEDDEEEEGLEGEEEAGGGAVPPTIAAIHPWYSIRQGAETTGADTPPSGGSSSRSASPGGSRVRKGPAPRPPQPPNSNTALSHSQPSSSAPSPAISIESLSSASDHSSSHPPLQGGARAGEDHPFTKSVSEPSISGPCDSAPPASASSSERLAPRLSFGPSPSSLPANTSSAPATPQTNRSAGARAARPPPPRPPGTASPLAASGSPVAPPPRSKRHCKENPFNRKASPSASTPKSRPPRGPRPARPPAPGHGFPLIKRKVQSDQYIPVEDIHGEMGELEKQLDELEQRGVELESKLRDNPNDEEEEHLLVDWFTLIHDKHLLVRREAELVYTAKQQNLEERQADVEYELRCLLNKPEKDWSEEDKGREQELMGELVTIIEQRNQIINNMDQDRQREEEEDKLLAAMLKKKDFQKDPEVEQKKKGGKFKPMKVLKRLSHKGEPGKGPSPHKGPSPRKEN
ncbi:MICAL-like protein 1 [Hypomesus transpacificus]|uniref:MICAL-like protein 1 n=1 Tax=Hypomesus transpacificus TaxID=137520 RepID=UPI001F0730E5|nr:MICAL-like protein 1 [Hypomesus transpacificus]